MTISRIEKTDLNESVVSQQLLSAKESVDIIYDSMNRSKIIAIIALIAGIAIAAFGLPWFAIGFIGIGAVEFISYIVMKAAMNVSAASMNQVCATINTMILHNNSAVEDIMKIKKKLEIE